ncbi:MAG: DUF393 domain-containing protein [Chitinophagaceae bacterium]|nr:MAG: DUF393 domain-containing protein [Chitinophagaceae bacterium]
MKSEFPVVFFDGFCNLCNGAVQFIIGRDKKNIFHFSSLQSDYAQEILKKLTPNEGQSETMVVMEGGKIYERSTAALRVARRLDGFWPLLYGFIIIPRFIRDAIYQYVAKNRYKWFGKQESCWVPTPELKDKFL